MDDWCGLSSQSVKCKKSHESKSATDSWKKNKAFPKKEKPETIQQKTRDIWIKTQINVCAVTKESINCGTVQTSKW